LEKLIVVLPDGMSDFPIKDLNNKTPLQVAEKEHFDFILRNGVCGAVHTVPDGLEPGSDVANLSILGVNSKSYSIGRGALEALAENIKVKDNEEIFRANFVTVIDNILIDYTGGNIKTSEAKKLINYLNNNFNSEIKFFTGVDYRNLAVIKDGFLKVKTVPPHNIIGQNIEGYLPKGKGSEIIREIMFKTYELLSAHQFNKRKKMPTNMVWLWGEGRVDSRVPSFYDKYGMKGAVISAVNIIRGIAKLLKMDVIDVPGITGDFDTNYSNKAKYALKNIDKYDFIYVHIEAPDEAGHRGNYKEKVRAIEEIDKKVLKPLLESDKKFNLLILPDHPTSTVKRTHVKHPVPFVLYSKYKKNRINHKYKKFSEHILKNPLVEIKDGYKLLEWVIKYLD